MLKRHLGLIAAAILALGGSLAIGIYGAPKPSALPQYNFESARSPSYFPGGEGCRPQVIANISGVEQRAQRRERCTEAAEAERLSTNDLIQQTRAADAAQAQATLGLQGLRLSFLQTIGGFLTLIAAAAAAAYAREAARETRRGADAAHADLALSRNMAHVQLRAYVDLDHVDFEQLDTEDDDGRVKYKITLLFKNYGQTPARMFAEKHSFLVEKSMPLRSKIKTKPFEEAVTMAQSATYAVYSRCSASKEKSEKYIKGESNIYLLGRFRYKDVFEREFLIRYWVCISEKTDVTFDTEPEEVQV